jgi:hypothetical protein
MKIYGLNINKANRLINSAVRAGFGGISNLPLNLNDAGSLIANLKAPKGE